MRCSRHRCVALTLGFLCLWPVLEVWSQALPEKQRKAFGKHANKVEAKAKELGLVFDYDEPPKALKLTKPKYPAETLRKVRDGRVLVMIVIDAFGHVPDAEILESTVGFEEAALACVRLWEFKPALRNGQAVGTVTTAPITFQFSR